MTEDEIERAALNIARSVIGKRKDEEGAPNAARLVHQGKWDDSHEVQDALLGARAALRFVRNQDQAQ